MPSPIAQHGVTLDNTFDPYVAGTDKAAATGINEAGVDICNKYAKITYGTAAAATGITCRTPAVDLSAIFAKKGTASYSLPIDDQTYSAGVVVPAGNSGSVGVSFALTSATAWRVSVTGNGGAVSPPNGTVLVTGALPAGAATIKYTMTYLAEVDDTGPGNVSNTAAGFTTVANGLTAGVTVGGTGTGSPKKSSYALKVEIANGSGAVISSSTCKLQVHQEGTG